MKVQKKDKTIKNPIRRNISVGKMSNGMNGNSATNGSAVHKQPSDEFIRSLIESVPEPLVTFNTEGKITEVNDEFVNIAGLKREKLIGTDFVDYFAETPKVREIFQQVLNKGFVSNIPLTLIQGHL